MPKVLTLRYRPVTLSDVACDPWPIVPDPECCPDWEQLPASARARGIRIATETIWALSGRQYQVCTACIRPCKAFCLCCGDNYMPPGYWGIRTGWGPYVNGEGRWVNCGCGCGGGCCKAACAVRLDPGPAIDILSVKIGGVVVPPNTYRVLDGNLLVRSAEAGCWPECNDLASPDTAAGTWSVTYSYGNKPSAVALDMAAILACEVAKLCANRKCRLSGRITQVTRDGVSVTLDPKAFIDSGLTSLPEIDQWLRVVNPYGLASQSQVWSPDTLPPKQVTWPAATC